MIILFSILAGVLGTGLGGLLTLIFGTSEKMSRVFLAFAGGVMISIVFFELIPESLKLSGISLTVLGLCLGILLVIFLNSLIKTDKHSSLRSGILMLTAVAMHDIPEGFAIGCAGTENYQLGLMIAIMIALHNVPEGMAVASPFMLANYPKGRTLAITFLMGAATVLGAVLGVAVGNITGDATALSLSLAGGAMLYVVFSEMFPISLAGGKMSVFSSLAGIFAGLLITQI